MDNAERAHELAGYWARVAELLGTPADPDTPPEQRLVVVFSAFRLISGCSWTTRPATNFDLAVGVEAVRRETRSTSPSGSGPIEWLTAPRSTTPPATEPSRTQPHPAPQPPPLTPKPDRESLPRTRHTPPRTPLKAAS